MKKVKSQMQVEGYDVDDEPTAKVILCNLVRVSDPDNPEVGLSGVPT